MGAARRVGSGRREVWVLVLGLSSAALLVAAALAPFSDPDLAGRAAFAQLAGRTFDSVLDEWERSLREPQGPGSTDAPGWQWDAPRATRARALPPEPALQAQAVTDSAFEVLLAEALRLESAGERQAALDVAREALEKPAVPGRRAAGRLLATRAALAAGDSTAAREQWTAAQSELTGAEALQVGPALLLCALAAAPILPEAERASVQAQLASLWSAGRLALPTEGAQLAGPRAGDDVSGSAHRAPTPQRDALRERLRALTPAGDLAALDEYEDLRALAAFEAALGELPARPADERWHLEPWPGGLLAVRAEGALGVSARPQELADLARALQLRVVARGLLPEGFALDFDGAGPGEIVRPRQELVGPDFGFSLRHADPDGAARAQGGRLALLRAALLGVAGLSAVAALTSFAALRRSRRLSELKSSFVANVSHELRTPLASILMLSENLEAGRVADEAGRARYHGLIRREAERLRRLVSNLLDFARLERGAGLELTLEEVDLAACVADLCSEARTWAARSEVQLEVQRAACGGRARLDVEALRRAVLNLLDNARKHSGSPAVAFSCGVREAQLVLGVEDSGRGLPAELTARLFEPFQRVEGPGSAPGTGLGLSIVREIALAHGGSVRHVVPDSGRGARFELQLPLETPA